METSPIHGVSIELPINQDRSDFYFAGPPELIYCWAPNGVEYRVRLLDRAGISSNEVKSFPSRFNVKLIETNLPRGQADPSRPLLTGDLVRKYSREGKEDLDPSSSHEVSGGNSGSSTVTRITHGDTSVSISDNGKVDIDIDGAPVFSADRRHITMVRETQHVAWPGGIHRVLLRENEIAQLIPTTIVTPFPNYIPDWAFLENAGRLLKSASLFLEALK